MTTRRCAVRSVLVVIAFLAAGQLQLRAAIINPTSIYTFTGDCLDCTGQGTGTLVLQNYTLGDPFDITNFVSFSYSSNLINFVLNGTGSGSDQASDFSGSLLAMMPAFADININSQSVQIFNSSSSGSWCAGINGCNLDFGVNGTFNSGVPEPASMALTFTGLAGLMLIGLRRTVLWGRMVS